MDGKVVQLSLREFAEKLLPVPRELFSAQFPPRKMALITEAFTEMVENYWKRAWQHERYDHPEDQLAVEFTQIVNEHVLEYVAGKDVGQPAGLMPSSSVAESTASTAGGTRAAADKGGVSSRERQGTSLVDTVPGYVMKVFPHEWETGDDESGEVRRLDDEPPDDDEEVEDAGEDDRTWSGAALFRSECQPELEPDQPNWPYQSAFVQFTQEGAHNDPFVFGWLEDVMPDEDNRKRVLRQVHSYADNISLYQHRTGVFSLVVMGRAFRVMRWDRSGVFVSERVDYVRDTRALVEVLLAFIVADSEAQGYDPTATLLPKDSEDYELMDKLVDETCRRLPVLPWAEGTPLPPTIPVQTYATFTAGAALPVDANLDGYLVDDGQSRDATSHGGDDSSSGETTTTTRRVLKDDSFVFQYVLDSFRDSLASGFLRYKLRIGSDEFLAAAPLYYDDRYGGARGYVAFHKQSGRLVFLKDAWRPQHPTSVSSEGEILRTLNEDGVRNVPTLLCHGMVDGQLTRVLDHWMELEDQRAKEARSGEDTQKDTGDSESEDEPRGVKRTRDDLEEEATPQIRHYVHYRIAVKEVCLPLAAFTSSRQLVSVVGDCIEAHYDATEKSKIIHRDVSSESIVILPTFDVPEDRDDPTLRVVWRGILADWEFATSIPGHGEDQSARQPDRTPDMWASRYMSVASFRAPGSSDAAHTRVGTADELESFFNVILHLAVRFCPHDLYAPQFIYSNFVDSVGVYSANIHCPVSRRWMIAQSGKLEFMICDFAFGRPEQPNEPLNHLLRFMLSCCHARYKIFEYEHETAPSPSTAPGPPAQRQRVGLDRDAEPARPLDATYELAGFLKDHNAVRELFRETKSRAWPEDEVAEDKLSFPVLLREAEAVRRAGVLPRWCPSASKSLPRGLIVKARRALPQRRILR